MPTLIFKLRNVPDDEANDIRELLSNNGIHFYETSSGNWGASMPAIWLKENTQAAFAKQLVATYQENRCQQARARYQQQKQHGEHQTLLKTFSQQPFRLFIYFAAIILVLYISFRIVYDLLAIS